MKLTTTATALLAAGVFAAISLPTSDAACSTQQYGRCGSKWDGVGCCPDSFYCQPWDEGYYQCMPRPDKCAKQRTNVDYLGNDLLTIYGIKPSDCCKRCTETPGCVGYTFINSHPGQPACYLKKAIGQETTVVGAVSGVVDSGVVKQTPPPTPNQPNKCTTTNFGGCGNSNGATCCPSGQYCQPWSPEYYQCMDIPSGCPSQLTDTDYVGNDIKKLAIGSPGQCCEACKKENGCKAYTYINSDNNGPACYLKSAAGGTKQRKGAVSGKR